VRSDLTVGRRRRAVHLTSVHAATYEGCIDAISSIRSNDHAKCANRMYSRGPGDVRAPIRSLESSCTSERDPAGRTAHHRSCSNVPGPDRGHQHHHQQRPWHVRESHVFKTLWRFLRPDPVYGRQLYERISWRRAAAGREASNSLGVNSMPMAREELATKRSEKPRCRVSYPDNTQQSYERALLNAVDYKGCVCSDVHRLVEGRYHHQQQRQRPVHDDSLRVQERRASP
jgi:hypothetical protein